MTVGEVRHFRDGDDCSQGVGNLGNRDTVFRWANRKFMP